MGRETELFKAAQTGNTSVLEKAFASQLKRLSGGPHHGSGLGSVRSKLHPNIQDAAGSTLLHHAILNGHSDTVALLLKCGASTKISDNSGSAPLHLAAWKGDLEIVKMLVTQGPSYANVNQQNDGDDTALHLGSQYGYAPVVEFLLQRHADPLLRNARNETALDLAAQYGHLSCVHFLISYSPESLRPTLKGFSPLHLAARNGHSLVALSLINAGISVNTVCDRGTALHEASMCGKMETVELLLDKGVNFDLKDSEGRTVLEVLNQFTANQATEISKKIQTYMDHSHRQSIISTSSISDSKRRSCRVIAIARNTSQPLVEGSSALPFHTGDHIQVERSAGSGVYVGSVGGHMGSFLAEDVLFYTEQDGELVATKECDLHMTPEPSSLVASGEATPPSSLSEEPKAKDGSTVAGSSSPELKGPLAHPHSDSLSSAQEDTPTIPIDALHRSEVFEMSTSSSHKSAFTSSVETPSDPVTPAPPTTLADDPVTLPSNSMTSEPVTSPTSEPVTPTSASSVGGHPIGKRAGSKKLSKKEKKFQLSKDDGKYAELNPINPHEAQKEFGNTLRLNPVGPAFGGVSSLEEGQVITAHNTSSVPGPEGDAEYMGSYYVLEVGNFDRSPGLPGTEQGQARMEPGTGGMPTSGDGYFLLNTDDPSLSITNEDGTVYTSVPTKTETNRLSYENVQPGMARVSKNVPVKRDVSPKLHPHLIIANEEELERSGQASCASVQSEGRASMYENVCPPSEREILPVPAAAVGVACEPTQRDGRAAYENVDLRAHPNTGPAHNHAPKEVRRSAQQRRDAYEVVPIGGRKVNGIGSGSSHNNRQPPDNAEESSIVQATMDNQFAGLVISASTQLEDSIATGPAPLSPGSAEGEGPFRERVDSTWDNQRVEQEWTDIDSLLQDMTGTIPPGPTSPSSLSPPPSSSSPLHQAKGDRAELVSWLTAQSLLSCASPLEVNGFDNLRFFGGGVLAMDDLVDIGITVAEDQYNLMAAVSLLAPPPSVSHASTVMEWLGLLDLLELENKFVGYSLKKISTLWDIELSSVVGVELLGYRKRLQYGIAQLRHAHPEWVRDKTPKSSPTKHISPKKSPGKSKRSPQTLSPTNSKKSFVKDYRSLRSNYSYPSPQPTSSDSLTSADLKMRTPTEAQSFISDGGPTRTPNLPSQTWKHQNSALISDSINFDIKYLGSVVIKNLHGNQSAEEACLKLRTSTQNMQKIPAITLSISWKGVRFMDAQSKKVVSIHAIRDVSCCAPDIEDKRVFAYITRDRATGSNYSHVFMAESQEVADDIRMTLGQAFEICYQKVMRARQASSSS